MDSAVITGGLETRESPEDLENRRVPEGQGGITPTIGREIFDKNVNFRSQRFPHKMYGLNPEKLKNQNRRSRFGFTS